MKPDRARVFQGLLGMDADIRALERLAATGDPGARAAWARAQARAGALRPDQLSLVDYLDRPRVWSERAGVEHPRGSFRGWVRGLGRFGKEACVRAAIAAAEAAQTRQPQGFIRQALQAARDWIECPCGSCADDAARVASVIRSRLSPEERAALEAACAAAGIDQQVPYQQDYNPARRARDAAKFAAVCVGEERVQAAIATALMDWARKPDRHVRPRRRAAAQQILAAWRAQRAERMAQQATPAKGEPPETDPTNEAPPVEDPFWTDFDLIVVGWVWLGVALTLIVLGSR